jgi:hypothetical protein
LKVNFNVTGLTCDGGSRVICEFANMLIANDHSVSITSLNIPYLDWMNHSPLNKKVQVKVIKPSLLMRAFRKAYLTKRGWSYNEKKVLTRTIPDCDVNISAHSLLVYPMLLSGKGKPIHFVQAYEPETQYYANEYLKRESTFSYTLPAKKLCVSEHLAKRVNGVNVGNGIDLNFYRQLGIEKIRNSIMGINTRSYLPWKNGAVLEQVFSELHSQGYIRLLPPRGTPDTVFLHYYNQASVYVFLSWATYEGFGLQPLEAMACGTPVITSPSISYVRNSENAYVLPSNFTVSDVVNAIKELTADKNLCKRLVQNGLETAKQYDFKNVFNNFLREIQN